MSCPFLNSMENFELIDMRHDFEELTVLQVNSFIFVVEEYNMHLTPATNFNTLYKSFCSRRFRMNICNVYK